MTKINLIAEPGKQALIITSIFDAPRERVFKVYTDSNLIPEWWGPKNVTTRVDKMDLKPGGIWKFVHLDQDGKEYKFKGVYHEIMPPAQLIFTMEVEGGLVMLNTVTFEEHDGKTKMTNTSVFQTVEDRDGLLKSGMKEGAVETMECFAEVLAKA